MEARLPVLNRPVPELQARGILRDGTSQGGQKPLLLQILSQPRFEPVAFQFIQRAGDERFEKGKFQSAADLALS